MLVLLVSKQFELTYTCTQAMLTKQFITRCFLEKKFIKFIANVQIDL